ncbi:SBE2.1, partial [Symbiodinium pilosum]
MASSSFPVGTAVKFWVPNLGARVPVDLSTGLPDYSEYVRSGLWVQRRRLRVCDGTGLTAYMPEGDRSWPDTFPVSNMKIYQTYCHMEGVTQEKVLNPLNALEILEGQVALVHHIMAFEEANPAVHVLSPRQKWKATFLAYFLGAVSQGQLTIMKQLGDEAYAASLADQNCWQVRTSKRLTYLLRHSKQTSLGRRNDALFENIDRDLQAFRWAPHKILGFLLGNTKSRFTVHVQLRRLDYDDEGQSSRLAIHMVYAGGSEAPKHGTHIQYGKYIFYCNVKYEELLDEGGALFLADNGVVLSYNTIPAKYLTFHTRPPHEK